MSLFKGWLPSTGLDPILAWPACGVRNWLLNSHPSIRGRAKSGRKSSQESPSFLGPDQRKCDVHSIEFSGCLRFLPVKCQPVRWLALFGLDPNSTKCRLQFCNFANKPRFIFYHYLPPTNGRPANPFFYITNYFILLHFILSLEKVQNWKHFHFILHQLLYPYPLSP